MEKSLDLIWTNLVISPPKKKCLKVQRGHFSKLQTDRLSVLGIEQGFWIRQIWCQIPALSHLSCFFTSQRLCFCTCQISITRSGSAKDLQPYMYHQLLQRQHQSMWSGWDEKIWGRVSNDFYWIGRKRKKTSNILVLKVSPELWDF